jgi:hypothetical protein
VSKYLLFDEFTLSVAEISWRMSVRGSMIQAVILLLVRSLSLLIADDGLITSI